MFQNWGDLTVNALMNLWQAFLSFMPVLLGAIIVFVIGWFVAIWGGKIVTEILKRLKFNELFNKGNWDEALAKANIKVDAAGFIGAIVKWILVVVFLVVTVDILGLTQFGDMLQRILGYLPHVLVAALIFIVTVIVSDIVEKVVRVSAEKINAGYGHMVSMIVKWAIWIFAVLLILRELVVAPDLIASLFNALVTGVVALFVISFGLAFGLGGKDAAAKFIEDMKDKMKK